MNTFEQYLYKDTKTIHYPNYINGHKAINLIRDKNNITININEVTIKLPKESLNKILENEGGVITINKQQLKLKKLKTSDHIDVIIRDENGNIDYLKSKIELYLEKCERPLIVQNLYKIEEILNIKLPKDRIYNIDEKISFEDYKDTINHQYTIKEKKLFIAGGSPHQNALTLSQLYFDKEILKNVYNQLDKIIQINQEIKGLEPIFDFNI